VARVTRPGGRVAIEWQLATVVGWGSGATSASDSYGRCWRYPPLETLSSGWTVDCLVEALFLTGALAREGSGPSRHKVSCMFNMM
jgi:hypothetical protein